jgi:hypothetical protein
LDGIIDKRVILEALKSIKLKHNPMPEKPPIEFVPFAKIKEEDLIHVIALFDKNAIKYEVETLKSADYSEEKTKVLHVEAKLKHKAQEIVDHYFSNKKRKKNKSSFYIKSNTKFVIIAVLFILWVLFKQSLKSGIFN